MKAVLLVGGTSGIGEGFARRFHALGKEVTISGRRADRLYALAKELPGLKTVQVRCFTPQECAMLTASFSSTVGHYRLRQSQRPCLRNPSDISAD